MVQALDARREKEVGLNFEINLIISYNLILNYIYTIGATIGTKLG